MCDLFRVRTRVTVGHNWKNFIQLLSILFEKTNFMNLQCVYFSKCYKLYKSLYCFITFLKIKIKTDKAYAFLVLAVENINNVVCLLGFLITYVNIFNSKLYLFFSMYCFYFEFNFVCIRNSCNTVKKL